MPKLRNWPALAGALDSIGALGLAVGAVVWAKQGNIAQGGLTQFLMIRVTLLNVSFAIVFAFLWKQCLTYLGLFHQDLNGLRRLVLRSAVACAIMTTLLAWYLQARHARGPVLQILATFLLAAFVLETSRVLLAHRRTGWQIGEAEQVLIVGSGRRASKAWRELRLQHPRTKRLLGFVDDRDPASMPPDIATRLVGNIDELPGYLLRNVVDELIVAAPMRSCYDLGQRAVSIAEAAGVRILCLNDVFTLAQERRGRGSSLFVELAPKDMRRRAAEAAKRMFDVLAASLGLVLLSPLLLAIAVGIKLTSPESILLVEEQQGYGRRPFCMYKFRSVGEGPRTTALGRWLRRSLLDELPQLWNVLLGDMSLVGPKPVHADDVSLLGEAQRMRRFSVRPGMTGNWQGSPPLSLEQWVALDFNYIDEWSLALDMKLLARTVPALIKRASMDW